MLPLSGFSPTADDPGSPTTRKVTVDTFLSLDGVMQAPGGAGEDPSGGFDLEGWSVNYWDQTMGEVMGASMSAPFNLLLGRKTYEIFAGHWPGVPESEGGRPINAATKYVVSTKLERLEWGPSERIGGDVVDAIRRLKQGDGPDLQVHGSSDLLQTLIGGGLVDEYRVWTFPLLLGKGKRLFGEGTIPVGLRLVDATTASTGVIIATYVPAGDIPFGTFARE